MSADIDAYQDQLVAWRRHLHQHPEASFEEHETVRYIRAELEPRLPGATFENLTPTSLVVTLDTGRPGPTLGLRADIDGLAMSEDRPDLDFASTTPGRMHGCGHDGHTATIMSALVWAHDHRDELTGTVLGIFQHAEETPPGGAKEMVETGRFADVDYFFGFHYWSTLPTGTVDIKPGPASANSDLFEVHLRGEGAHASTPEDAVDVVTAASSLIQQFLLIPSRRVAGLDPCVVSTTWMDAGRQSALNVYPPEAHIGGVVRTHDDDVRDTVEAAMRGMVRGLQTANPGLSCELDYLRGYDMVWNDPGRTAVVHELCEDLFPGSVITDPPMLGGEDFAAFSRTAPATYVFVGAGNAAKGFDAGHHNPRFGLDEDAFPIALRLVVEVLRNGPRLAAG